MASVRSFITRGRIKPTSLDSQIIMFTLLEGLSIYGSLRPFVPHRCGPDQVVLQVISGTTIVGRNTLILAS